MEKTLNEKKKDYLNSYRNLSNKLISLEEQLQTIREMMQSARVQKLSDMPKARRNVDLSDYMVKLEIVYTKIIKLRADCINRKLAIENQIADLTDGLESSILHKKYIEFKTWDQICLDIGYEWAQTHRKHLEALKHFKVDIE